MNKLSRARPIQRRIFLLAATSIGLYACGKKSPQALPLPAGTPVLALGDSLTEGVGTGGSQNAWPALLARTSGWDMVNAGISGDTSAQALARLPELLDMHQPQLVIISIGGNDFLRQTSAQATRENIRQMVRTAQATGTQVLLIAVPQFSLFAAGTGRLNDHPLYAELADELNVPVHSGAWSAVLSKPELRSDQIHANTRGYAVFAKNLQKKLIEIGWWP